MPTLPLPCPAYRCQKCHRLLFYGYLLGVIVCSKCGYKNTLDIDRDNQHILVLLLEGLQEGVASAKPPGP